MSSDIYRDTSPGMQMALGAMNIICGKTSVQGAQTTIFAAVSEEKMNGRYLSDCRETYPFLKKKTVGDSAIEAKVYKHTKNLLGLS